MLHTYKKKKNNILIADLSTLNEKSWRIFSGVSYLEVRPRVKMSLETGSPPEDVKTDMEQGNGDKDKLLVSYFFYTTWHWRLLLSPDFDVYLYHVTLKSILSPDFDVYLYHVTLTSVFTTWLYHVTWHLF